MKKLTDKPEDIHSFAIGINPRDPQFVYWVRNIQILDQVPPPTDSELIRQSMAWNQAKRFARSSSGELDISFDDKENAVRFDVNFNQETTEYKALYFASSEELLRIIGEKRVTEWRKIGDAMREIAGRRYTWKRIGQCYAELF